MIILKLSNIDLIRKSSLRLQGTLIGIGVAPITQLRMCAMKTLQIQGKLYYVEMVFPHHKGLLSKERFCSKWEQILSLLRSCRFYIRESVLVSVVWLYAHYVF